MRVELLFTRGLLFKRLEVLLGQKPSYCMQTDGFIVGTLFPGKFFWSDCQLAFDQYCNGTLCIPDYFPAIFHFIQLTNQNFFEQQSYPEEGPIVSVYK